MGHGNGSRRMQARRKAKEIQNARMVEAAARAQKVAALLTDYFSADLAADAAREAAQAKADQALRDGDAKAQRYEAVAAASLAALLKLGETRTAIAEATGLSLTDIRAAVAVTSGAVPAASSAS